MLTFLISPLSLSASLSPPHPLKTPRRSNLRKLSKSLANFPLLASKIKIKCRSLCAAASSTLWDPFQGFPFDTFQLVVESCPAFISETSAFANTRIDWKETPEAHVFKADLPGMTKEEVKVEVEGRILQISSERSREEEEKSDKWHCIKRSRFRLPKNAKVDQVKASMDMIHSILIFFRDKRF